MIIQLLSWHGLMDLGWLVFLLLALSYFWKERTLLQESQNWLKTKAQITGCEWAQDGPRLWPEIEYHYQVYEQDYIGHYLFLDTSHNNPNSTYARQIAYKAAMAYEKNDPIEVYYNPFHPEQSALDIRIPQKLNLLIYLLGGLIILHLGIIVLRFLF